MQFSVEYLNKASKADSLIVSGVEPPKNTIFLTVLFHKFATTSLSTSAPTSLLGAYKFFLIKYEIVPTSL